jgi:hypothetical protein
LPLAALDVLPERFQCVEFALPPYEGHFGGKLDHRWRDYGRAAHQALVEGAHLRQGLGVQFVLQNSDVLVVLVEGCGAVVTESVERHQLAVRPLVPGDLAKHPAPRSDGLSMSALLCIKICQLL